MSSLNLSELLLMSDLERRAKRVPFHRETTLVRGGNSTGKSSILKSIYYAFGAEAARQSQSWKNADVTALMKFEVDGVKYEILRKGTFFAVFNERKKALHTFQRVTHGLGPFLAQLFSFGLKLNAKDNEIITPPPAYFFLPYYVDQDVSWATNWSAFARLEQIRDWRTSVVEYHTGIKPNEYYLAKAALQAADDDLKKATEEATVIGDVRKRMQQDTRIAEFDINIEDFQEQLGELLAQCAVLLKAEEDLKDTLRELNNTKSLLDTRTSVVQHALHEINADYHFATDHLTEDLVDCPTCGAVYENSFIQRFEIAKDEDRLTEMLLELRQERTDVDRQIQLVTAAFREKHAETTRVQELLSTKRQEVSLGMVLKSEGRKEVDAIFKVKLEESHVEEARLRETAQQYRAEMKRFENKTRRDNILDSYRARMRSYLHTLNVDKLPEASYKSISARITELGSEQPRALLAYYFSILHTIKEFSTSAYCPMVIDSPNQQGQDDVRLPLMLNFIRNTLPAGTQLILGLESNEGVDFTGSVVELSDRYKLLQEAEYEEAREELRPMLTQVLS